MENGLDAPQTPRPLVRMNTPGSQEISAEIERYRGGIAALRAVCADLTTDQLSARPVAGRWSLLECLCHIADFEPILAYRMKSMLAFENPELVGIDETEYGKALRYQERDAQTELAVFSSTREQMLGILQHLRPEEFVRTGRHTELGNITVWTYVRASSGHVEHHMRFMNEKRVAFGHSAIPCPESRDYPARGEPTGA